MLNNKKIVKRTNGHSWLCKIIAPSKKTDSKDNSNRNHNIENNFLYNSPVEDSSDTKNQQVLVIRGGYR